MTLLSIITFHPVETQTVIWIVAVLLLLCASAFVSGSETAFFSLTPADLNNIKKSKSKRDDKILRVLADQDYLLATILVTNNLVNICIVILSNNVINSLMSFNSPGWEFALKVVFVTFMLLLLGEITPKVFAAYNSVRYATFAAPLIQALKTILKPFSYVLIRTTSLINRKSSKKGSISIGELSEAIEITKGQSEEEREMLTGIVDFVNTEVEQIMHQRLDIVAINIDEGFDSLKKIIMDSGFSRIPVYRQSLDDIAGVLYVKDMIAYIGEKDSFRWQDHLRKPYFIPEHKKINDLMVEFQNDKVHMGIVVDEYGSTMGLVSLEDILEEIVGEILDESDADQSAAFTRLGENTFIFDGKCHINEFTEAVGLREGLFDKVRGDAETVAGLMLELKRDFLQKGESVTSDKVKFTVISISGRRIDRVKVEINRSGESDNKKP